MVRAWQLLFGLLYYAVLVVLQCGLGARLDQRWLPRRILDDEVQRLKLERSSKRRYALVLIVCFGVLNLATTSEKLQGRQRKKE